MKTFSLVLALWAITFHTGAQTPADYFLPLCNGNYNQLHTDGNGTFMARHTYYRVMWDETVSSDTYYFLKGYSIEDSNQTDTQTFQCIWLQRTAQGEIMMAAVDYTNSGLLDSATILIPPIPYLSTEMLTPGYVRDYTIAGNINGRDSVISNTETVGTYQNCLKIRTTRFQNIAPVLIEDFYYAAGVGYVKIERLFPAAETHVASWFNNRSVNCYTGIDEKVPSAEFNLYPNPAHASVNVQCPYPPQAGTMLELCDALGKQHMRYALINKQENLPLHLPEGIYFYSIYNESGILKQGRVLIQ
ncbi:MAG: T9SS type A sorting domain-containing protein [Bacteroidia bacterium]|jgi:hypothetical protein